MAHRAAEQSHDWYVEFVLPEPEAADTEREKAIRDLKAKMEDRADPAVDRRDGSSASR